MCKDDHLALKRAQAPRENGSDLIETETQDAQVCDTTNIVQEIPELLEA